MCISSQTFFQEYLIVEVGFDTEESDPPKVFSKIWGPEARSWTRQVPVSGDDLSEFIGEPPVPFDVS